MSHSIGIGIPWNGKKFNVLKLTAFCQLVVFIKGKNNGNGDKRRVVLLSTKRAT